MLPGQKLTDTQKVILRLYAKDSAISIRKIVKKIIKPDKTMVGVWVQEFEKIGLIKRIGIGRNMRVFVTDAGRKEML